MSIKSTIITKTGEIADTTLSIDHSVFNGESLLIGVKDIDGNKKTLLEIKAGSDYFVTLKGVITDNLIPSKEVIN